MFLHSSLALQSQSLALALALALAQAAEQQHRRLSLGEEFSMPGRWTKQYFQGERTGQLNIMKHFHTLVETSVVAAKCCWKLLKIFSDVS